MTPHDVTEFGGWPRPPRWVWAAAGLAVVALLAVVVAARTGPHHAAASPAARTTASPWPAHAEGGACHILASGGTVWLWNPAASAPLPASAEHSVSGVAFSPDGKLLAIAGGEGTGRLWNLATGPPAGGVVPSPGCLPGPSRRAVGEPLG